MIRFALVTALAVASALHAQAAPKKQTAETTKPATTSLRSQAENEAASSGVATKSATDASVSGVLTLKDPGIDAEISPWTSDLGLRMQNLLPAGVVSLPSNNTYNLEGAGSSPTPWIDLGAKRRMLTRGPVHLSLGGRIGFAYMSRQTEVVFSSGFREDNARLSTGLATGGLYLSVQSVARPEWEGEIGWQQGVISYAQGGNNDVVNFSRQARFSGPQAGLIYWVGRAWGLNLDYAHREISETSDVSIQQDNYSFGARIIW